MLRPSTIYLAGILALCLCSGSPALAQLTGLSDKLDVAEKQLNADIESCKRIDMGAYEALVSEANRNYKIATEVSIKSSAPTDLEKLHADFNRAVALRDKAKTAAQMACELAHGGSGTKPIEVETKVEPPKLPPVTPAGNYRPSTSTIENSGPDYVGMFRAALARYLDAKKRCDGPGMMAARAEMDAAQAAAREILAGEKVLGGKSELLKKMAEQRQAAENGTVSMCPKLPPTLAHMLSEPPRVSSEPMTDEASTTQPKGVLTYHAPTIIDPALAARAHALCSGPTLGDLGKLPAAPRASDADAKPNDQDKFHVGLKYTFDGSQTCPTYQDTRVPPPELPNKEVFGPVPTGNIDPDYSDPIQVDITPTGLEPPPEGPK